MLNHFNEKSLHSIDGKGRLMLPKEVRAAFKLKQGDVLYLLPDLASPPYVAARTRREWELYVRRLQDGEMNEQKKNSFRYAMMFVEETKVDGAGRILVPIRVREQCGLNGKVAVIPMGTCFEIWSQDHIATRINDLVQAFKRENDRML